MTLFLNNEAVAEVLTMRETIAALEDSYRQTAAGDAVCRPRIDVQIPIPGKRKLYQWGTMEGGSKAGYFAIRMKSDVIYEQEYNGVVTQEKYCTRPGKYCGLILLTSAATGEPLAFINDGVLQHMRVGADGAIGVKYMSRENAKVVGMLGSGGMARTHMEGFMCVRGIERLQVFSPTPAHREAFAEEMRARYGIEAVACDDPRDVYRGADILAGVTDSAVPVLDGELIEKGCHVLNIGGGGRPDQRTLDRVDLYFRFGRATAPWGLEGVALDDEYVTYAARQDSETGFRSKRTGRRGHGAMLPDRMVTFADIVGGRSAGRSSPGQITYSERGNLQGAQFWAVGGLVYEKAKARGLGHEIPTDWLLQDIRN